MVHHDDFDNLFHPRAPIGSRIRTCAREAEPRDKRSLAIAEKALGPEHLLVTTVLNNLAFIYQAQGRFAESEPPKKRSLAIFEKVLGRARRAIS